MKPWHSVVVPHRDIREGRFDESVFAASLSDVVASRGPLEYRDAATFLRQTYPTQGLVNLLAAVVGRLAGTGRGEPVIQVQTPFGGGKTHALVALYHLLQNPNDLSEADVVREVLQRSGARALPETRVVSFDGTVADPLGRTPWGELAFQLGRYEVLQEHDRQRRTPGKELLHSLLEGGPTLILMDEIAEYAVKARDFQDQVMAFFQELTETVKVAPNCALVVTLPSSAPYGEEGERALDQLQRIFGRLEAIYAPVEGAEVFEVIRRRLFEGTGDAREGQMVAEEYWQMYQRLGEDAPGEARDPAYRERLRLAYPFHPQVIDLLYERWSTFPTFQRTRGVLRLLANVVADLYGRQHPAALIQTAHLNLANPDIRRELLKHVGNAYEGVIAADIVDSNAKAQRIDREMGSEYARFGVASGLATAIFFGSFSGGERRGINAANLRLALLQESIPPAIVGDALQRLENELWYLHLEGGLYQFRSQPNLNRVMLEREEAIKEAQSAEAIQARLRSLAGSEMRVTLFPEAPGDIPDTRELKLAVLGGEHPGRSPATTHFAEELLNRTGSAFRVYRNTLLLLAPDAEAFGALRQQVRRFLALKGIQEDQTLQQTLSPADRETVASKLRDAEGAIEFQLRSAYRHLAKAGADSIQWWDMGLPTVGERGSLAKRARDYLKSQDILLERIKPEHIVTKTLANGEEGKSLGDIYDAFLRYPHLPLLESEDVLHRALVQGAREGTFGVQVGEKLSFGEAVEGYLPQEAVLVRSEVAQRRKQPEPTPPPGLQPPVPPPPGPPGSAVHELRLKVRVPWDKMSDFVKGVLLPLHLESGAQLTVEILLEAHSLSGIKVSTLEQKVGETLQQIGAEVLEDSRQ
ncbi:MAG: ATP-binding protein [Anaerolineae bacterium]